MASDDEELLAPTVRPKRADGSRMVLIMMVALVFFVAATIIFASLFTLEKIRDNESDMKPKNFILMVSDGFGPASETFARNYAQHKYDYQETYQLPLDRFLVGASRTRSSDSLVTDSAVGATAFSCAIKSYNGAISVDPERQPCPTVLEAAQKKGMKTGLVATSRITHATPACFAAHVVDRDMENEIAVQEVEHKVDLMFGGGLRHFIPKSQAGSVREDERDLLEEARANGAQVILDRAAFDSLSDSIQALPVLGLFNKDHMSYEIDRNPATEPSLPEMASKALKILKDATKGGNEGFFIMIEGSRIDHAAHENDAATHYHEIMMYQKTFEVVEEFLKENPDTSFVSVSDHECGGLTLGRRIDGVSEYFWLPEVLDPVTNSSAVLAAHLRTLQGTPEEQLEAHLLEVLEQSMGITDPKEEELADLLAWINSTDADAKSRLIYTLAEMINVRAHLAFTTNGHTGVDVNLYSAGRSSGLMAGNHENTEIGQFIVDMLELDLGSVVLPKMKREEQSPRSSTFRDEWEHHYHHSRKH